MVRLYAVQAVKQVVVLEGVGRLAVLADGLLVLLEADTLNGSPLLGLKVSPTVHSHRAIRCLILFCGN